MKKVIIIGDLFLDILPSALPIEKNRVLNDGETFVDRVTFQRGGCAGNFAAVIKSLMIDDEIMFISKVGSDPNGDFLISQMQSYGIKTLITKSSVGTAITIAVSYQDGERHFITYNGAMDEFKVDDIDFNIFDSADSLVWRGIWFTPNLLHHASRFLQIAKQKGLSISMDLGFDPFWATSDIENIRERKQSALNALKYVDFLFGNTNELLQLTNKSELKDAVEVIKQYGAKRIIVHKGAEGSEIYDLTSSVIKIITIPAFSVRKVINPVGTGDTYDASFIYRLIYGDDLKSAALFASQAASYSISSPAGTKINYDAVQNYIKNKT